MSLPKATANWPKWLITMRMPEFWHFRLIYLFILPWVLFMALFKTRGKFYPFALNQIIDESGGFSGASKGHIKNQFDASLFPKTVYLKKSELNSGKDKICRELSFPFIIKPTNLNSGVAVNKIDNKSELQNYLRKVQFDFQAEEYLTQKMEVAVFIANPPDAPLKILSLTGKEFLTVTGDGVKTIKKLLKENLRYKMCSDQIDPFWENKWTKIPKLGDLILIQPIGNHNKGTKFTDESHRITSAMEHFLDSIVPDSIQYGRFDIKLDSWSDLETGKNLKIIEFNGNIAEPVSYLDPKFGYIGIQRVLFKHYYWQYKLGKKMVELGTPTPDYITGCKRLLQGKKFKKSLKNIRID